MSSDFYDQIQKFVGLEAGTQDGHDEVNQAMIRHWVEAMGDENPVYVDAQLAAESIHGERIAPPVMLQAWVMRGLKHRPESGGSPQDDLMNVLDGAGFTSVVATNCEQEYDRMLHLGDHLRTRTIIDSISDEKQTALGTGHFLTTRVEYETLEGEPVGRMLFRILKFKPGTGRSVSTEEESPPRPLRPRPALNRDNQFWFEAAKEHRLVIQKCSGCGVLRHPPRPRCDKCGSYEHDAVEASGKGTIYSFVVIHYPQVPSFDYPLPVGLIALEEGTRLVADLTGAEASEFKIDMPVILEWQDLDSDLTLPAFRPVKL